MTVSESAWLAERFEEHRGHLRAVAYRMLGSLAEADEAVQEAWIRVSRSDAAVIENLGGWLTTVVARVCLGVLERRREHPEEPLGMPEPIVSGPDEIDPEQEALLAESVGLALLVVLETLEPAERLAFVLHDMFALPFSEIAPTVGRSPVAARQLASRARRRVRGVPVPDVDRDKQREAVDAFLAASRDGDFDALLAVLDPDVVVRAERIEVRGAENAAAQALTYARLAPFARPALVNGAAGLVAAPRGRPFSVMGFTVTGGKIVEIDIVTDPERLSQLDVAFLDD